MVCSLGKKRGEKFLEGRNDKEAKSETKNTRIRKAFGERIWKQEGRNKDLGTKDKSKMPVARRIRKRSRK